MKKVNRRFFMGALPAAIVSAPAVAEEGIKALAKQAKYIKWDLQDMWHGWGDYCGVESAGVPSLMSFDDIPAHYYMDDPSAMEELMDLHGDVFTEYGEKVIKMWKDEKNVIHVEEVSPDEVYKHNYRHETLWQEVADDLDNQIREAQLIEEAEQKLAERGAL